MPSSHLILCCPLFLLPSIPPSIRVFSNESALHIRWPKYWSFKEHPGLIFRMNWLDLLAVQGILKSLFQHHSSKALILLCSVQFSSVAQSCPTLCDPMNRSTPGLLVHHQLLEFTQTHVHRVGNAIQPSHHLLSLFLLPPIPSSIRVFQ